MRRRLLDIGGAMVAKQALVLALMYLHTTGILILVSGTLDRSFNE